MKFLDKAKQLGDKVGESVTAFSSDEAIANTVIKAVEKQEKVNRILEVRGCNYRVSDIELGMGIPPSVTFGVRRVEGLKGPDNDADAPPDSSSVAKK